MTHEGSYDYFYVINSAGNLYKIRSDAYCNMQIPWTINVGGTKHSAPAVIATSSHHNVVLITYSSGTGYLKIIDTNTQAITTKTWTENIANQLFITSPALLNNYFFFVKDAPNSISYVAQYDYNGAESNSYQNGIPWPGVATDSSPAIYYYSDSNIGSVVCTYIGGDDGHIYRTNENGNAYC
jgi:hypothetical protein